VSQQQCAVCNRPASVGWWQEHAGYEVECSFCGRYRIGLPTYKWMRQGWESGRPDQLLPYLSVAIRQSADVPVVTSNNWEELAKTAKGRPSADKVEALLALLKSRSAHPGAFAEFGPGDAPLVGALNEQEADFLIQSLRDDGLISGTFPLFTISPKGWQKPRREGTSDNPRQIFLSHAATDQPLAASVAAEIEKRVNGSKVFVASQPGHIRTGDKWLNVIEEKLSAGDAYVILLTPSSIERPWLWFETGSVWFSNKQILPILAGSLPIQRVPFPLSARQIQNIERPDQLRQFFRELAAEVSESEANALVLRFRNAASIPAEGWQMFVYEDRKFVWDGPLGHLQDRSEVIATRQLMAALEGQGFKSRCARPALLGKHGEKGYKQVFESDLATWKRPVKCPDTPEHLWIIRPADSQIPD
jgi:TIR domain